MKDSRRGFIKSAIGISTGLLTVRNLWGNGFSSHTFPAIKKNETPRIRFSVIGINHGHIYGQVNTAIQGGGELVAFHAKEDSLAATFTKTFPQAKRVSTEAEILEDHSIQLVVSAAIPCERAPLGIRVMEHGKDFMVDKPGITSLSQLANVRKVQRKTGRIFSILYGRLESKAVLKASELIKAGAIGKVVQVIGLGPHRVNPESRPEWFFDKKYFGGIICDIGTHLFDQFLFLTGSTSAKISASQVGNIHYPQYRNFEDFGDALIQGNHGSGYIRVDWLTPDGLNTWGDGRLTILGTEGYIEIRSNIDIAGRDGGNHLFLVDKKSTQYINCRDVDLPYGRQLIDDILNRTETAMTQQHCFLATELTLLAQKKAIRI
jgi:predicted dehydrogenase